MPELNVDRNVLRNLRAHLEAIRDGAGPNVDLLLDLNFNAKTEGFLKILRAIADFDMFWVEIDSYNPAALAYIRRQSPHPISSCETLLGLREFLPYLREQAMDVVLKPGGHLVDEDVAVRIVDFVSSSERSRDAAMSLMRCRIASLNSRRCAIASLFD